MTPASQYLLSLIRAGIGQQAPAAVSLSREEWKELTDLSFKLGVNAISVDGYSLQTGVVREEMQDTDESLADLKFEWFGSVLQTEAEYHRCAPTVDNLCQFLADNGFRPVLLKGLGMSLDYPLPEHRHVGDIDIFLADGRCLEADRMIKANLGLSVKKSKCGHHSHFKYNGFSVENHYELSNTYFGGSRTRRLEERLRDLVSKGLHKPFDNCPYFLPSADFNAVFLLWHMGTHFCGDRINLSQLCDWFCFLKAHHNEIDWPMVEGVWKDTGLSAFALALRELMRKAFLMPGEWMPVETSADSAADADRIIEDVLFGEGRKSGGISNALYYIRNAWKYKLVTGQSWVRPMMGSVWMHLFNPGDLTEHEI